LEYLELYGCEQITIEGIKPILQTMQLRELNLDSKLREEVVAYQKQESIVLKVKIISSRGGEI